MLDNALVNYSVVISKPRTSFLVRQSAGGIKFSELLIIFQLEQSSVVGIVKCFVSDLNFRRKV